MMTVIEVATIGTGLFLIALGFLFQKGKNTVRYIADSTVGQVVSERALHCQRIGELWLEEQKTKQNSKAKTKSTNVFVQ